MGKDGETCTTVVSNSVKDIKSVENHPHGKIVGSDSGY